MSEAKHTPGPWEIIGDHQDDRDVFANNELIATAYDLRHVEGDARANARLIAAAPELLEALGLTLEAHGACDGQGCICEAMRAAIRKAKGQ